MTKSEAEVFWNAALREVEDEVRYPRVQPVDGGYSTMEEMLSAKERGDYDHSMSSPNNPCHLPPPPSPNPSKLLSSCPFTPSLMKRKERD